MITWFCHLFEWLSILCVLWVVGVNLCKNLCYTRALQALTSLSFDNLFDNFSVILSIKLNFLNSLGDYWTLDKLLEHQENTQGTGCNSNIGPCFLVESKYEVLIHGLGMDKKLHFRTPAKLTHISMPRAICDTTHL